MAASAGVRATGSKAIRGKMRSKAWKTSAELLKTDDGLTGTPLSGSAMPGWAAGGWCERSGAVVVWSSRRHRAVPFPAAPFPRTRAVIRRSARGGQAEIPLATSPAHGEDRGNVATPSPQGTGADLPCCHAKNRISCPHGCIVPAGWIRLRPLEEEHLPLPGALEDDCSAMRDALKDVPGLPGHLNPHTVHSKGALCISNRLLPSDTGPCSPARPDERRPQVFRIAAQRPPFGLFALMCGRVETKAADQSTGRPSRKALQARRIGVCRRVNRPPRRFHIAVRRRPPARQSRRRISCRPPLGQARSESRLADVRRRRQVQCRQIVQSIIGGIE